MRSTPSSAQRPPVRDLEHHAVHRRDWRGMLLLHGFVCPSHKLRHDSSSPEPRPCRQCRALGLVAVAGRPSFRAGHEAPRSPFQSRICHRPSPKKPALVAFQHPPKLSIQQRMPEHDGTALHYEDRHTREGIVPGGVCCRITLVARGRDRQPHKLSSIKPPQAATT